MLAKLEVGSKRTGALNVAAVWEDLLRGFGMPNRLLRVAMRMQVDCASSVAQEEWLELRQWFASV